jgi:hypothetical protein
MTEAFDKLKAMLEAKGALTDEEIASIEGELGALEDEERLWLSAEIHDRKTRAGDAITLEQYVAAAAVLDSAASDSPEYLEAQRIVEAFESAA